MLKEILEASGASVVANTIQLPTKTLFILTVAASIALALVSQLGWFEGVQRDLNDQLVHVRASQRTANERIVVIDIDDTSMNAMAPMVGKWPWPRSVHAELLEFLLPQAPAAVVFDLLFSEPDLYRPDADTYFAETLATSERVYLAAMEQTLVNPAQAPLLASYPKSVALQAGPQSRAAARASLLLPKAIPSEFWRLGLINYSADSDGVARRYPVFRDWQGWRMLSLAARVAGDLGADLPTESQIQLDWAGAAAMSYPSLSYVKLLAQARGESAAVPADWFGGRIVIVGSSALGLHDLKKTPVSELHPGSFILATAIDNFLSKSALEPLPSGLSLILSLLVVLVSIVASHRSGLKAGLVWVGLGIITLMCSYYYSLVFLGLLLPVVGHVIILLLFSCGLGVSFYRHFRRDYRRALNLFSHLLDPEVVKQLMLSGNANALMENKHCELTVLFSDIRSFTSMSESRTPDEVINLLNHYFEYQVATLFSHKATVDKFIGDAVMAFWGAPLPIDNPEESAISAALDMVDNLETFKKEFSYKNFNIGIGIHTGRAVVGMVGTSKRYDYTAIGDSVNLASRIEGLTKDRACILVSESTMEAAKTKFDFEAFGEFQVKGRTEPVRVYEPRRKPDVVS